MSLPYYKRFPRDFLDATVGMSLEQKGAYGLVLDLIFMRGNLPDDSQYIAGQLGCSVRKWNSLREYLVSVGKLKIENGMISNFRADILLEETRKYREQKAENRSKHKEIKVEEKRPSTKRAEIQITDKEEGATAPSASEVVEDIWKLLPRKKRGGTSKAKLLKPIGKLLKAKADPVRIIAAVAACYSEPRHTEDDGQYAPAICSWLSDGVWENWEPQSESTLQDADWRPIMRAYCETRHWPSALAGPAPHEEGCRAPAGMLKAAAEYFERRDESLSGRIQSHIPKMEQAA